MVKAAATLPIGELNFTRFGSPVDYPNSGGNTYSLSVDGRSRSFAVGKKTALGDSQIVGSGSESSSGNQQENASLEVSAIPNLSLASGIRYALGISTVSAIAGVTQFGYDVETVEPGADNEMINIHDYGVIADGNYHSGNAAALQAAIDAANSTPVDPKGRRVPIRLYGEGILRIREPIELGSVSTDFADLTIIPDRPWTGGDYLVRATAGGSVPQGYHARFRFFGNHLIQDGQGQPTDFACLRVENLNAGSGQVEVFGSYFSTLLHVIGNTEKIRWKVGAVRGWRVLHEEGATGSPDSNHFDIHASEVGLVHQQGGSDLEISGSYNYMLDSNWDMAAEGGGTSAHGHPTGPVIQLRTRKAATVTGVIRGSGDLECYLDVLDNGGFGGHYTFDLVMFNQNYAPSINFKRARRVMGRIHVHNCKWDGDGIIFGDVRDCNGLIIVSDNNRHRNALVLGGALGNPASNQTLQFNHYADGSYGANSVVFGSGVQGFTIRTDGLQRGVDFGGSNGNRVIGSPGGVTVNGGSGEVYDDVYTRQA
ncbi:hypothetical protein [Ferrimonas balearica]|uniref:hypothetical protein n=1 Tax=Ferrimonas balearica TaxID=44012 RepID=UPI001F4349F4|nr:hypothetical protein [Ferrimonas balearica]MBY6093849.1 hypothetical protein [Ferrimonas balearica]